MTGKATARNTDSGHEYLRRAPRPLRGRTKRLAAATLIALALAVWSGLPAQVLAQADDWVPEIPLTRELDTSARAMGMGGAYLALSDDAAALRYNPAGLARIQRVEFLGSLTDLHRTSDTEFYGAPQENSISRTRISSLAFAYPFPTYRGSMVIALGYSAPWMLDRQYGRMATFDFEGQPRTVQEDIFEEGQVGEWSFGYAVDAAPGLALGFRTSWIHGTRSQDWIFLDSYYGDIHEVADIDMGGFTGALGAMSRVGGWGRLGLTVNLPRWIQMDGTILDVGNEIEYVVDEKMTLPYSVGIGLSAVASPNLLLAGDARYTDWTQIDYEGALRYWERGQRRMAYRRTWDLHVGGEYLLDQIGLTGMRVRAGFAWEPVPYQVLLEDVVVEGDTDVPVYQRAHFDPDRTSFTAGLGVLLAESLTIDAAFATGKFQRSGVTLVEEEAERRILVTAAYRLD